MANPTNNEVVKTNLHASKFSAEGFLGSDNRLPEEIIAADERTMIERGIELKKLVSLLKSAYEKAREALGVEIELRSGIIAVYYESMGRIPSPFPGDGVFEKGEVVITETQTGRQIILTPLAIHLIEKYHFFQGTGCRHRIDPAIAIELVG
ncbi:MAG: hypothetical protein PHW79_03550 [Candidatus Marinimicrobia bacterium]|nr:hypothetical protein [Candidatus Neomarinimicrobiota bacterium]